MNDLLERAKGLLERCVHVGAWTERQKADWILEQGRWLSDLAAHKPQALESEIARLRAGLEGLKEPCGHTMTEDQDECDHPRCVAAKSGNARIDAILGAKG